MPETAPPPVNRGPGTRGVSRWRIFSWQLYDFADTIFSMNVNSLYFGNWIRAAFGATSVTYGWASTLASLLSAVATPILGAASDASQRKLPYLRLFAVLTFVLTFALGFTGSLPLALVLFVAANVAYTAAGSFYQALLPGLANEKNLSLISGIGVALGYAGSVAGMVLVGPFVGEGPALRGAFVPTALLFMIFALPGLLAVPDFVQGRGLAAFSLRAAFTRIGQTLGHARQHKALFRFLVADFIYENAVAAVISFMAVYANIVVGFNQNEIRQFLIFSTVFAIGFSFLYGLFTDRVGPKTAVLTMLAIWTVTLGLTIWAPGPDLFRFIGPLAGLGLGSTWIASRTMLVALTPVERAGEFFGLYSLSGKSAGVVGLATWTAVTALLTPAVGEAAALRGAVGAMLVFVLVGAVLVFGLPNARPSKENILQR